MEIRKQRLIVTIDKKSKKLVTYIYSNKIKEDRVLKLKVFIDFTYADVRYVKALLREYDMNYIGLTLSGTLMVEATEEGAFKHLVLTEVKIYGKEK